MLNFLAEEFSIKQRFSHKMYTSAKAIAQTDSENFGRPPSNWSGAFGIEAFAKGLGQTQPVFLPLKKPTCKLQIGF